MNDTEKMGTITLVTPPSIIENLNETFCLLNFSDEDKDQFMNFLNEFYTKDTDNLTVYIADQNNNRELYNDKRTSFHRIVTIIVVVAVRIHDPTPIVTLLHDAVYPHGKRHPVALGLLAQIGVYAV